MVLEIAVTIICRGCVIIQNPVPPPHTYWFIMTS